MSHEIIAVSKGVQRDLVENFNIPEEKVSVIYNPYDIDLIKQNSLEKTEHRWLGNPDYKSVITVGSLEKSKNHALLIKAFKKVADKLSNARLIIIGEGTEQDMLRQLSSELDLTDHIDFTGELKNPFSNVSQADLFVLSSDTEGFPNVLVEAMICGCPVISTDCKSGPDEIIRNAQNGYLVPVGDIDSLSNTIVDVLQNNKLCTDLINKANETVRNFELSKIVQQYYQTLNQN